MIRNWYNQVSYPTHNTNGIWRHQTPNSTIGKAKQSKRTALFSSPDPKAHKVSLLDGTRLGVRASVRACVHTFKHEYLWDQQADYNQILSEASLGWGKAALGFGADQIRTLVSMATDSSHRVIMGKRASSRFLGCFDRILFILAGNYDIHRSLHEFEIRPDPTTDNGVSCPWASEKNPIDL